MLQVQILPGVYNLNKPGEVSLRAGLGDDIQFSAWCHLISGLQKANSFFMLCAAKRAPKYREKDLVV
jgi:hypothetical protein